MLGLNLSDMLPDISMLAADSSTNRIAVSHWLSPAVTSSLDVVRVISTEYTDSCSNHFRARVELGQ